MRGHRIATLTQTTDLMPTMLDIFGQDVPAEVTGVSILPLVRAADCPTRMVAFGMFGGPIGITDGALQLFSLSARSL